MLYVLRCIVLLPAFLAGAIMWSAAVMIVTGTETTDLHASVAGIVVMGFVFMWLLYRQKQ